MAETIQVQAPGERDEEGGARVVLVERDPAHPVRKIPGTPDSRSVYICEGDGPVEVGLTPAVAERLRDGRLVKLDSKPKDEAKR